MDKYVEVFGRNLSRPSSLSEHFAGPPIVRSPRSEARSRLRPPSTPACRWFESSGTGRFHRLTTKGRGATIRARKSAAEGFAVSFGGVILIQGRRGRSASAIVSGLDSSGRSAGRPVRSCFFRTSECASWPGLSRPVTRFHASGSVESLDEPGHDGDGRAPALRRNVAETAQASTRPRRPQELATFSPRFRVSCDSISRRRVSAGNGNSSP